MLNPVLASVLADPEVTVSRIEIEIIDARRFRWTLRDEQQRELFSATGRRDQVEPMTRAVELLVNAALGVAPTVETPRPSLN